MLEASNNVEGIHNLMSVCKLISIVHRYHFTVVDLGYDDVVEILFSESCYENLFGIMECDFSFFLLCVDRPELATKGDYRNYFKTHVHFRNTMSQLNPSLLTLIHKLYRLLFYRDAIDPQPIEEIIPSSVTSLIASTISELVHQVCTSESFVKEVLEGFDGENAHLSLRVVKELFEYCRNASVADQEALVRCDE